MIGRRKLPDCDTRTLKFSEQLIDARFHGGVHFQQLRPLARVTFAGEFARGIEAGGSADREDDTGVPSHAPKVVEPP